MYETVLTFCGVLRMRSLVKLSSVNKTNDSMAITNTNKRNHTLNAFSFLYNSSTSSEINNEIKPFKLCDNIDLQMGAIISECMRSSLNFLSRSFSYFHSSLLFISLRNGKVLNKEFANAFILNDVRSLLFIVSGVCASARAYVCVGVPASCGFLLFSQITVKLNLLDALNNSWLCEYNS